MATDIATLKAARAGVKGVWNLLASVFNPTGRELAKIPELASVLQVFGDVAAATQRGWATVDAAVKGADPPTVPTAAEAARQIALQTVLTTALQTYEQNTRFQVLAITLERDANGLVIVGGVIEAT